MTADHEQPMRTALSLARDQLGRTWPNPSVGAVIVKNGDIIASAATATGGRPHAETQAIAQAGDHCKGSTLYVTLEPCSHHGKTPPCVDAVISAGFSTVVIACGDPNPEVNGQGIAKLKAAGINVIEGICQQDAEDINRGFFSVIEKGRPFISLKIATSLDGKIADNHGKSQWITSERAREYGQLLRSQYDAIATGIGTVLADDPLLTCRLPGLEDRSPVRIVYDRRQRLPASSRLVQSAGNPPVWVVTDKTMNNNGLYQANIDYIAIDGTSETWLENSVKQLANKGITRLLIEAGAGLSTAFLQSGLVDRMYWFRAPLVIGNDGLAAFGDGIAPSLDNAQRWHVTEHVALAPDSLDILARD
jgi:diaminohydroxyphosphoribosylaminopyrimidine deaminase/5-amino-6-(5-phosphoribosylamino)uracil reductase